ncbi:helix-turn-helix domain-containing protein [Xanthobacter sp. VNH20]|uniref:winged helix-turn-helix transcriptional regulator n=1 Tax=Xanthobacter sp. VNH20 TaxID=3156616 RepID=UPI0032B4BB45
MIQIPHPMRHKSVWKKSSNREDTMDAKAPGKGETLDETAGCQLDHLLKFLAQEWMSHIVWALGRNTTLRFGALRRALPGPISARVLSGRLKDLEANGFVIRRDIGALPLHVEYSLTEQGRRLDALLSRSESPAQHLNLIQIKNL